MAGALLFLPSLPMLPTPIRLSTFLYDLEQITIPTDNVDDAFIGTPQRSCQGGSRRTDAAWGEPGPPGS